MRNSSLHAGIGMASASSRLARVNAVMTALRDRGWVSSAFSGALALGLGVACATLPLSLMFASVLALVVIAAFLLDFRFTLLVLFTAAPLKALIETEVAGAVNWPLDIGQILFVGALAVWFIHASVARRSLELRWHPIATALTVFILAAGLSFYTTVSAQRTLKETAIWLSMLIMSVLVAAAARRVSGGAVVAGLLFAACVQCLIGVYEFFGGSGAAHLWILDFRYFRAFGSFGQPNPFGAYMGLTLPLAVGLTIHLALETQRAFGRWHDARSRLAASTLSSFNGQENSRATVTLNPSPNLKTYIHLRDSLVAWGLYTVAAGIASIVLAVGLFVSWSRGAWIGFAAAVMVMAVFSPRRLATGLLLATLALGGGGLALITGLVPQSVVNRFSDFTQDLAGFTDVRGVVISDANYAVMERFAHWQAALWMATDSPWTGIGFGAYELAYPRYPLINWPFALGHAHNYYLNVLAEAGLVGLVGYVFAWLLMLAVIIRTLRRAQGWKRGLALGILGVCVHLLIHSLFDKLYVNNLFLHIGAILGMAGWLAQDNSPAQSIGSTKKVDCRIGCGRLNNADKADK